MNGFRIVVVVVFFIKGRHNKSEVLNFIFNVGYECHSSKIERERKKHSMVVVPSILCVDVVKIARLKHQKDGFAGLSN